jgi:two-component system chemotaxis sensor kinase CheA
MIYPEEIFVSIESDSQIFLYKDTDPEFSIFLSKLEKLINEQMALVNQINLGSNIEEILDNLYRNNYVLFGMTRIFHIQKLNHLFEILNFVFDLTRKIGTIREFSTDYLIKLLYDKSILMIEELNSKNTISIDTSDLIEESKNYLLPQLKIWNDKFNSPNNTYNNLADKEIENEYEEVIQIEKSPELKYNNQKNSKSMVAIEIPFNDEPETLNFPIDKIAIISDFYEENTEILENFANSLLELENSEKPTEIINNLFRMIHTVKGGARLLNIKKLEFLAHNVENLLDLIRHDKIQISSNIIDLFLDCKTSLSEMMEETASRGPILTRIRTNVERLQVFIKGIDNSSEVQPSLDIHSSDPEDTEKKIAILTPKDQPSYNLVDKNIVDKEKGKNSESLKVSSEKLDEVLNTASEIFIGRIRFQNEITSIQNFMKSFKSSVDRASELQKSRILAKMEMYIPEFSKDLRRWSNSKKHSSRSIENFLSNLFVEMISRILPDSSSMEMSIHEELNLNFLTIEEIQKQLQKNLESLEQLSTRLQNGAMSFRMVPISNLFEKFPMQIRDLARSVNKKVKVNIIGGDTELDKVLINKIGDPLLHMLRNSIDHGIEKPEDRIKLGKSEIGTITLKTYYYGSYAVIEIRDDGKGIDTDRLLEKAYEKDLVTENKRGKLSNSEILDLIFLPGFSTNDKVTELSGRGVGMDVVKTAINQLHGTIEIDSQVGKGTCFKLKLPLTLAIVKILLVQESSYQFALPILNIEALITLNRQEIKHIDNRLIFNYKGQTIPVASLSTILDFPQSKFKNEKIYMVILNENNKLIGILVDSVLGRQEILIKNLGRFLTKAPFVMGCTILRDSRLVLILDPRQIADGVNQAGSINKEILDTSLNDNASRTILIVDDSALQRENLKAILKNADFHVDTAENGFDALKACKTKTYSAFCVDIIMPLMDGYEFVERLRKIQAYQDVPIFLISSKDVDQSRISNLNIASVFQKPINGDQLISQLNEKFQAKVKV